MTKTSGNAPTSAKARSTRHAGSPARVSYLVGQLDRLLKRRIGEVVAEYGLTVPQYTALSVIDTGGMMTNAKLAQRSFITPQSANEVVKAMEANEWVARADHPTHARLVHLYLTEEGRAVLARCDMAIDALEASMLQGVDDVPVDTLRGVLHRCVSNLRD